MGFMSVYASSYGIYWSIPVTITGEALIFNITAFDWDNETPVEICWETRYGRICSSANHSNLNMMGDDIFNVTNVNTTFIYSDNYCNATHCYNLTDLLNSTGSGSSIVNGTPFSTPHLNATLVETEWQKNNNTETFKHYYVANTTYEVWDITVVE